MMNKNYQTQFYTEMGFRLKNYVRIRKYHKLFWRNLWVLSHRPFKNMRAVRLRCHQRLSISVRKSLKFQWDIFINIVNKDLIL